MKKNKETKIKGLKTESLIAFMVLGVILIMTIYSTVIGYSFKMDTAKAETITDLSNTTWTFNNTISELVPNQYYYINFYYIDEEDEPPTQTECTNIKMYVNSAQTQKLLQYDTNTTVYIWQVDNPSIPKGWRIEDTKTIYIQGGQDATNSTFIAWIQQNATQVTETIDYTPQIEISNIVRADAIMQGYDTTTNTNQYYGYIGDLTIFKVNNANLASTGTIGSYFALMGRMTVSDIARPVTKVFNGLIGDDGKGYIIIAIPESVISITFYYADYQEYTLVVDNIQNEEIKNSMINNTSALKNISQGYSTSNYEYAYRTGYNAGMETDQTLLSVIWGTMQLPFNIMFGTYNSTNQTYEGGLFNFTILGIDVRAFTIGLMSLAIILGIIRIILGKR